MNCIFCTNLHFESYQFYSVHLRNTHRNSTRFSCNSNCKRIFSCINTHLKHVKNYHFKENSNVENDNTNMRFSQQVSNLENNTNRRLSTSSDDFQSASNLEIESSHFTLPVSSHLDNNSNLELLKIFLKILSDDRIPRTAVFDTFKDVFSYYDIRITNVLSNLVNSGSENQELLSLLRSLLTPSEIKTEYLVLKHLRAQNLLINYETVDLGKEFLFSYANGNQIVKNRNDFFYIMVDIQQLFHILFSKTDLLAIILNYMNTIIKSPQFHNIIQSKFWKEKLKNLNANNEKDTIFIPVMIYFDDFEILNIAGSHSGQYKIGAVYIKILVLPEHLSSKLTSIFLVMLFFSEDRKKFGNKNIFKKLVEKLNFLQNEGIFVNGKIIKIIPCMVGGDNLGINSILGFVESFNSSFFCRFCKCSSAETKLLCVENKSKMRNMNNYKTDLDNLICSGIKENSVFNLLNNFHVIENKCVDIMHDLLEGICHYDLLLILKIFVIEKKMFTIELLNKRIELHDFGPGIKKPPLFDSDCLNKSKLKLTASEMLVMIKYLPFLLGDIVKNCIEWNLLLTLREIIYILFKNCISFGTHIYLESLIEQHNTLFLKLSNGGLKPKFHILVHYPTLMDNIGPLVHTSSMRFESKHQVFKKTAHNSNNRINILKSLHIKNQFKFAKLLLENSFNTEMSIGSIKKNKIQNYTLNDTACEVNWISFDNITFKKLMIICVDIGLNNEPIFGLIEHVIRDQEDFYFCVKIVETWYFDNHYFAYRINSSTEMFKILNIINLKVKFVSHISKSPNGEEFVMWDK